MSGPILLRSVFFPGVVPCKLKNKRDRDCLLKVVPWKLLLSDVQ